MLLIDSYPWMRYFLPKHRRYLREGFALQAFFLEEIQRHEATLDEKREPDNFIDCYLKDMQNGEDDNLK
jgi:hypothetical protein